MTDKVRARKRKTYSEADDVDHENASRSKKLVKGARSKPQKPKKISASKTANGSPASCARCQSAQDDEYDALPDSLRSLWKIALQVIIVVLLIFVLYLVVTPSPIDPQPITHDNPLPRFEGVLSPNTILQEAVKILEGKISAPESITQDRNGNIYTGLGDGRIVRITKDGKIQEIKRTGDTLPTCGTPESEPECGRPLGIRFDRNEENLIVCDAYLGLLKVNPITREIQTLLSSKEGMDGVPFKFLNDLVIASDGTIYFTDSSWKWQWREIPYHVTEGGGQGRLMSYHPESGERKVLLHGLYFPNGVELSPKEDFVLFCETTMARVTRHPEMCFRHNKGRFGNKKRR